MRIVLFGALFLSLADVDLRTVATCSDGTLTHVAHQIAESKARGEPTPDEATLGGLLRLASDVHPWPRAWLGSDPARGDAWSSGWKRTGEARCGSALVRTGSKDVAVTVAIDALADFEKPVPLRARTGEWIDVIARLLVPADRARVVVSTDSADPRTIVSTFDGRAIRSRVSADRPGAMTIQVVADVVASGPRPVLEAVVFVDVEPATSVVPRPAPGEWAGADLGAMVGGLRSELGLPAMRRSSDLDVIASEHTKRMIAIGSASHDAGDGSPIDRLLAANLDASEAAENVAHAATLALAHRAMWNSPSHRKNLVRSDFSRVGLSAIASSDGSVWVTELLVR